MLGESAYVRLETLSRRSILKLAGSLAFAVCLVTLVGATVGPEVTTHQVASGFNASRCASTSDSTPLTIFAVHNSSIFDRFWTLRLETEHAVLHRRSTGGADPAPVPAPRTISLKYALVGRRASRAACEASGVEQARWSEEAKIEQTCRMVASGVEVCETADIFGSKLRAQHAGDTALPYCIAIQTQCSRKGGLQSLRVSWNVEGNEGEYRFMGWLRALFCSAALALAAAFWCSLRRLASSHERSPEQTWILWLTRLLFLYNDPWGALVFEPSESMLLPVLVVLGSSLFWAFLLGFWLVQIDHIRLSSQLERHGGSARPGRKFYKRKWAFVATIWFLYVVVACYDVHASYSVDGSNYSRGAFKFFMLCMYAATAVYVLWVSGMLLALWRTKELHSLPRRFQYLLATSVLVGLVATAASVATAKADATAASLVAEMALFNGYVFLIAFLYSPAGGGGGEGDALAGGDSLWRGSGSDNDDEDDVDVRFPTLELPPFPSDVVDDAALRNARMILAEEIEEDI